MQALSSTFGSTGTSQSSPLNQSANGTVTITTTTTNITTIGSSITNCDLAGPNGICILCSAGYTLQSNACISISSLIQTGNQTNSSSSVSTNNVNSSQQLSNTNTTESRAQGTVVSTVNTTTTSINLTTNPNSSNLTPLRTNDT